MPQSGSNFSSAPAGTAIRRRTKHRLDEIDVQIIRELQSCANITTAALASRLGISAPSTQQRIRKLESSGVITGYVALLDPALVNMPILAIVHVRLMTHTSASLQRAKTALGQLEEVLSCWHTAGDEDFVLRVIVSDMNQYEHFISQKLSTVADISSIRTAFVLNTVKHTTQIPLASCNGDGSQPPASPRRRKPRKG